MIIPAFAQNVSLDEKEQKIQEEIKDCEKEIRESDSMTEAQKTVAIRQCPSEIRKNYEQEDYDNKVAQELKIKLQNIQRCEDWHQQYTYLTAEQFVIQKNFEQASDCVRLYNESIWEYIGEDRAIVLSERLDELKDLESEIELVALEEQAKQAENVPVLSEKGKMDKISELEEKVEFLEKEVSKKNAIIHEQVNVIMDLANRVRDIIGEIGSMLGFNQIQI